MSTIEHDHETAASDADERVRLLCASVHPSRIAKLSSALAATGKISPASLDETTLIQEIAASKPSLLFLDFDGNVDASALAEAIRREHPALPIIALGSESNSDTALIAMRAGARDLLDIEPRGASPDVLHMAALRALERVSRLLAEPVASDTLARRGKLVAVFGARGGVGVSTFVANLATLLQKRLGKQNKGAALLDLGLPAADSTLLLDTPSELHFHDAVRNLRRFDQTFVHTAFARHSSGLALMTLPADLAEMRTISYASAVKTLDRLRAFFDYQIVDLGGFSNLEFVRHVIDAADTVWLVCDANVASAVSAASLCASLDALHNESLTIPHRKPELIVNKYDPSGHLAAEALATRLDLALAAVLPARAQMLMRAVNQGQLLGEIMPKDPYVRAVDAIAAQLAGETLPVATDAIRDHIARFSARFLKR
ncbi:fimbrial protein [Caballeronia sp. BR00000012568055]|uniref:AAA family ATPase n=1 Tax=Caballeronia sp. BR00000012568055 TaxID=2918761 RepID=UPI0023F7B046|nr:fimbrial protein [Caballeronia sp. BR00000012568055]